jgi:hypothetical protein
LHSRRARGSTATPSPRRAVLAAYKDTQYPCMIVPRPLRANYVRSRFLMTHAGGGELEGYEGRWTKAPRPVSSPPQSLGMTCQSLPIALSDRSAAALGRVRVAHGASVHATRGLVRCRGYITPEPYLWVLEEAGPT